MGCSGSLASIRAAVTALSFLGLSALATNAQSPVLLRDCDPRPPDTAASSAPGEWTVHGPLTLFLAFDLEHGRELWASDGSVAGTRLVLDITPGTRAGHVHSPVVFLGERWFSIDDGLRSGLWRSDGTAAGTRRVFAIGDAHGELAPSELTVAAGQLFFVARDAIHGDVLFVCDGSASGTRRLATAPPDPDRLASGGGLLVFRGQDPVHGSEPFVSDGSETGTRLLVDTQGGAISLANDVRGLTPVPDGRLLFFAGGGLWSSDGSAAGSTELVEDLVATSFGAAVTVGAHVYFAAREPGHGAELWRSDGSVAGTGIAADLVPGFTSSEPRVIGEVGGQVIASTFGPLGIGRGLWSVEGASLQVTRLLTDASVPFAGTGLGLELLMSGSDPAGNSFFATDGTLAGTRVIQGPGVSAMGPASGARAWLALRTDDGVEPGLSDGTAGGTGLVVDLWRWPPSATRSSNAVVIPWSRRAALLVRSASPTAIFDSDGTPLGTAPDPRFGADPLRSMIVDEGTRVLPLGGGLGVLAADDTISRRYHLFFDSGAHVTRCTTLDLPTTRRFETVAFGNRIALILGESDHLLVSDGTAVGTIEQRPTAGGFLPIPQSAIAAGDVLFFAAGDGVGNGPLWVSDGETLRMLMANSTYPPYSRLAANGFVVFAERDPNLGLEPYVSDGTVAGTHLLADLAPGIADADPQPIGAFATSAVFSADDGVHGRELWITDGSSAGTRLLADLVPGTGSPGFGRAVPARGALALPVDEPLCGNELWWIDANGARRVIDLVPGPASSSPRSLARVGDELWFTAEHLEHGTALWRSDGSAAGTRFVMPLRGDAIVAPLDGRVILSLDDLVVGREPFVMPAGAMAMPWGAGCSRAARVPWLEADAPRLGATIQIGGGGAEHGMPGFLVMGLPAAEPLPIAGSCRSFVELESLAVLRWLPDAGAPWFWSIAIPNLPALEGLVLAAQSWCASTTGPMGLSSSNGLRLAFAAN